MENHTPFVLGRRDAWIAPVLTDHNPASPVLWAVRDWCNDAYECLGIRPKWLIAPQQTDAVILVVVAGQSPLLDDLAVKANFRPAVHAGPDDSFAIEFVAAPWPWAKAAVVVTGANGRAAMHGLYKLGEIVLGADPLQGWTGMAPARKSELVWDKGAYLRQTPPLRWRGVFINDEDALMSWRGEPDDGTVVPEVQQLIIRTLCRLGGNMLAPPMWAGYMDAESRRELAERGIFYTASHLEVLLTNPQRYWAPWCQKRFGRELPYSFTRHPDELEQFWRESVAQNREFPVIWPVGLRGAADCPFWQSDPDAPTDMRERARVVSAAIARQIAILRDMLPSGSPVVTSLTMRDEVLDLFETGALTLPEETLLVWDDVGRRSIIRSLPDARLANRKGGNGLYYHLAFCQNPRMQYLPIKLIYGELMRGFKAKADQYLLINVGNLREVCLQAQFAMQLAVTDQSAAKDENWPLVTMRRILADRYGEPLADRMLSFYLDFTEIENGYRVSQVAECVAPLVTTHELYNIWDPVSAIDFVREKGDGTALREFANRINFKNLPDRCWCFDPARLDPMKKVWDGLLARLDQLALEVPDRAQPFLRENLRLQVQTSRCFNAWAADLLAGFDCCAVGDFPKAAALFESAAKALWELEAEREAVAVGEAAQWFRGEYHNVFKKSLWTLKPRWHAEDTSQLAEITRQVRAAAG